MVTVHTLLLFFTLESCTSVFVAHVNLFSIFSLSSPFSFASSTLGPRRSCAHALLLSLTRAEYFSPYKFSRLALTSVSWVASVYAESARALEVSRRFRIIALCCVVSSYRVLQVCSLISCEVKTITKTFFLWSKNAFDFEAKSVTGGSKSARQ